MRTAARGTAQCEGREDRIRVYPSVEAKASWNKTAKVMQRNALCSVISQTFRGAGTSVARVRWTAHYSRASARGSNFVQRRIPIAGAKGR